VPSAPLLRTEDLTLTYPGGTTALDGLTVDVPAGSIGLVGANGAGKTTLLRLALGLLQPTRGRIEVAGFPVADDPVGVRRSLGFMPEHDCLPLDQTAADVVATLGELAGLSPRAARQRASEVLDLVGLDEARFRPIGGFSTGMRQRTKLAQAIVADPALVLLDEPTAGLDPLGREEMLALLTRLASFGISVLIATHLLDDVQRVCDSVVLIDGGRLVHAGPTAALLQRTGSVRVELGGGAEALADALLGAGIAAAALDAATALDEARQQGETARVLLDLARALADVSTVEEVTERLARAVPAVVACDRATVWLWDSSSETLRLSAFDAPGAGEEAKCVEEMLRGTTLTAQQSSLLAEILAHPVPRFVDQGTEDMVVRRLLVSASAEQLVVVPLRARTEFLGLVVAARSRSGPIAPRQPVLLQRVVGLADHAATAIEKARLLEQVHHQALHDSLTGLPNERLLRDRVDRALAHNRRSGVPFSLLFCDLDGFKPVNDLLGHETGDAVLCAVADRLRSVLREEDTVSRLGGDEFVLLLRGSDAAASEAVATKIRTALAVPVAVDGHRLVVNASIGVAEAPRDGDSYEVLLGHADRAMYEAKLARRRVAAPEG